MAQDAEPHGAINWTLSSGALIAVKSKIAIGLLNWYSIKSLDHSFWLPMGRQLAFKSQIYENQGDFDHQAAQHHKASR